MNNRIDEIGKIIDRMLILCSKYADIKNLSPEEKNNLLKSRLERLCILYEITEDDYYDYIVSNL